MARLKRQPSDATMDPDVRGPDRAGGRLSVVTKCLARTLSPYVTVSVLLGIVAVLTCTRDRDRPRSAPDLPPLARARIDMKEGIVGQLIFHPGGDVLYSGDAVSGGVVSWNRDSGLLQRRFENPFPALKIKALCLARDGRTLAACFGDKGVALWDTDTGALAVRLAPESWDVSAVTVAPDGHTLAAAGWDGTIRVWDISGPKPELLWSSRREGGLNCLAIAPDGRTLAVGGCNGWLRCWDRFTGQPLSAQEGDGSSFTCVAYSPDGRTLAAGSYRGRIRLWDALTHRQRPGPDVANLSSIVCMAYAPDGRSLATGHVDRVVRLWDPQTGTLLRALTGHQSAVRSLGFTPDGRELASGSSDATIVLWDMARALPPGARGKPSQGFEH
jgi:WD40 repeat protein